MKKLIILAFLLFLEVHAGGVTIWGHSAGGNSANVNLSEYRKATVIDSNLATLRTYIDTKIAALAATTKEHFSFSFVGNDGGNGHIPTQTFTPTHSGEYVISIDSTAWINTPGKLTGFYCNISGTDNDDKAVSGMRFFHEKGKHRVLVWQKKKVKLLAGRQVTLTFTKSAPYVRVDHNDVIRISITEL